MRGYIHCIPLPLFIRGSGQGRLYGRDMYNTREERKMHTKLSSEKVKERDHLEDPDVVRIMLKSNLK
jgi:hypothetical protein